MPRPASWPEIFPASWGDFLGERINRHVGDQIVQEGLAPFAMCIELRPLNPVSQLNDRHRTKLSEDLSDTIAAALGCYQCAGVEDQSHERGVQGFRARTISSTSAAKSASNVIG